MPDFNKPLELPPQLHWKLAHEPELLGWTIKARNYDLFFGNLLFIFLMTLALTFSTLAYIMFEWESWFWRIISSAFFPIILLPMVTNGSHRRVNIAYRLTKSGLEYCLWKYPPRWPLILLKWLTPAVAVLFLFLATVDPSFLLGALVGPAGMVLTYLSLAHSKSLQALETEYHHMVFEWNSIIELNIATNREVINLTCNERNTDDFIINWTEYIYCKRKQKKHVANFIKPYLMPGTPITRAKVEIWP